MSKPDLGALSFQLLDGGVAPRHVRRLVREVSEHFDDLQDAHGEGEASRRIGTAEEIVRDALARPALKSWGARWPWAVYGVGPTALMVAIPFVFFFSLLGVLFPIAASIGWIEQTTGANVMRTNPTEIFVFDTLCFFFSYVFVPLLGLGFGRVALRQRRASPWVRRGIAALCMIGGLFAMGVDWPSVPGKGPELWVTFFDGRVTALDAFLHVVLNFALVSPVLLALQWTRGAGASGVMQTGNTVSNSADSSHL